MQLKLIIVAALVNCLSMSRLIVSSTPVGAGNDEERVCPKACTYISEPTCAFNAETTEFRVFGNRCMLDAYNQCDRWEDGSNEFVPVTDNYCEHLNNDITEAPQ